MSEDFSVQLEVKSIQTGLLLNELNNEWVFWVLSVFCEYLSRKLFRSRSLYLKYKDFHNEGKWMTPWIASYHTNAEVEVDIGNYIMRLVSSQWLSKNFRRT